MCDKVHHPYCPPLFFDLLTRPVGHPLTTHVNPDASPNTAKQLHAGLEADEDCIIYYALPHIWSNCVIDLTSNHKLRNDILKKSPSAPQDYSDPTKSFLLPFPFLGKLLPADYFALDNN